MSVDLTAEELWILFREAALAPPAWMDVPEPAAEVVEASGRGLVARGVRDGGGGMLPAVAEVLLLVARPRVFAAMARECPGGSEVLAWPGDPGVLVEVEQVVPGIWRFTPTEGSALAGRLHAMAPADAASLDVDLTVDVPIEVLDRALGLAPLNDVLAARELVASGAEPDAADAFVRSAADPLLRSSLTGLWWSESRAEGGTLGWLQGRDGALWLLPPSAHLPDPLASAIPDVVGLGGRTGWRASVRPTEPPELDAAIRQLIGHETFGPGKPR